MKIKENLIQQIQLYELITCFLSIIGFALLFVLFYTSQTVLNIKLINENESLISNFHDVQNNHIGQVTILNNKDGGLFQFDLKNLPKNKKFEIVILENHFSNLQIRYNQYSERYCNYDQNGNYNGDVGVIQSNELGLSKTQIFNPNFQFTKLIGRSIAIIKYNNDCNNNFEVLPNDIYSKSIINIVSIQQQFQQDKKEILTLNKDDDLSEYQNFVNFQKEHHMLDIDDRIQLDDQIQQQDVQKNSKQKIQKQLNFENEKENAVVLDLSDLQKDYQQPLEFFDENLDIKLKKKQTNLDKDQQKPKQQDIISPKEYQSVIIKPNEDKTNQFKPVQIVDLNKNDKAKQMDQIQIVDLPVFVNLKQNDSKKKKVQEQYENDQNNKKQENLNDNNYIKQEKPQIDSNDKVQQPLKQDKNKLKQTQQNKINDFKVEEKIENKVENKLVKEAKIDETLQKNVKQDLNIPKKEKIENKVEEIPSIQKKQVEFTKMLENSRFQEKITSYFKNQQVVEQENISEPVDNNTYKIQKLNETLQHLQNDIPKISQIVQEFKKTKGEEQDYKNTTDVENERQKIKQVVQQSLNQQLEKSLTANLINDTLQSIQPTVQQEFDFKLKSLEQADNIKKIPIPVLIKKSENELTQKFKIDNPFQFRLLQLDNEIE